ncbi:UNVERIFIED_CONTAM: Retrovirus-related Pol polyprotein from transposon RE2 [Sesamum indicum]
MSIVGIEPSTSLAAAMTSEIAEQLAVAGTGAGVDSDLLDQDSPIAEIDQYEKEVLYLHPSENSSFVLASSPLNGSNYLTWSRAVYVALGCKMKLAFIDGTFPRPPVGSALFEQWRRADLMVTSWLWNSISRDIVEGFMYVSSSRELWLEIHARYRRSSNPMIYQIQREISSILQGDMTLTSYLTKVKKLWNELFCLAPSPKCTCGSCNCGINKAIGDMYAATQLMQFLMGLHESFDKEKSQLLMMDPLPDLEKAFSMIFVVEQQRNVQTQLGDNNTNAAYQIALRDGRGSSRQMQKCKTVFDKDKRALICTHCHKQGHLKETCFQIHGKPEWYKALNEKKKQSGGTYGFAGNVDTQGMNKPYTVLLKTESQTDIAGMMDELLKIMKNREASSDPISNFANYVHSDEEFAGNAFVSSPLTTDDWIIDSSATNHVCANLSLFESYSAPKHMHFIHLPDGTQKAVTYIGTIRLTNEITLDSVLYISNFAVNLLSVSQLCNGGNYTCAFNRFGCVLQDLGSKRVLAKGKLNKRLYILRTSGNLNTSTSSPLPTLCTATVESSNILWHARMGHASLAAIKRIPDCNISRDSLEIKCDVCPQAKQSRVSFNISDSRSAAIFDLVHLDVWGPYKTPSLTRCNYVLTILDDYSRSLWTYLLKHKDQVASTLLAFVAFVDTQYATKIKQNGRIERKHRQLLNVARALLFQASLPNDIAVQSQQPSQMMPHRSTRASSRPLWLDDFVCQHDSQLLQPCSTNFQSFVASLTSVQEPRTFAEVVLCPHWREAMNEEIKALEKNRTWRLTQLPAGKCAIGCKWVYKIKLRADSSIERYKARLVAKVFNQVEGIDCNESFSPVAKAVIVRLFFTLAAAKGWILHQLDVNNTFLHGYLDEDIYMVPPAGYNVESGLVSHGLISLLVYVDNILLVGTDIAELQKVKNYLHRLFTIKDIGQARYFLGLEIARSSDGIFLAQTKYILDILADTGLQEAKSVSTPLPPGLKLNSEVGSPLPTSDSYRRLIGRLLYLSFTRPNISYPMQKLSQYLNAPCEAHWKAVFHVVKYLKGCPSLGLFLPAANSLDLQAYCDADWASCPDSRHSLTGFCIFLRRALVSWKTKKQSTISRSSAKAEYRSLAATVCELRWLSFLLVDFGVSVNLPILLFCDNRAAIHILTNPVFHERTKHIEIDCHAVRDAYKDGFISPVLVRSFTQVVDIFTKALSVKLFQSFIFKLSLVCFAPSPTCRGAVGIEPSTSLAAAMTSEITKQLAVAGTGAGVDSDLLDQG